MIIKGIHFDRMDKFPVTEEWSVDIEVYHDENDVDVRDYFPQLQEETWKLMVDESQMVRSYDQDPTRMGMYRDEVMLLVEVEEKDLPSNFFAPYMSIFWAWNESEGVHKRKMPPEEVYSVNKARQQTITNQIMLLLAPLNLAEKYGIITEEEMKRKEYLEKLMIEISRVDLTQEDIDWPILD